MFQKLYEIYSRCLPEYPVTEETFFRVLKPETARILTKSRNGVLAGFAMLHQNSVTLLCVDEPFQGEGIGSELLEESEALIRKNGAGKAILGCGPHYLLQGVPEENGAPEFFKKRGYTATWSSVNMSLPLGDFLPEKLDIPPLPKNIQFCFAEPKDGDALLKAVESAERNWMDLFRDMQDPVFLAVREGEILGFQCLSPEGGQFIKPDQKIGSIGCVGVVEKAREQGIGRQMVAAGARWLKEQGCTSVELRYVYLEEWYRKIGFETVSHQWMGEKVLN